MAYPLSANDEGINIRPELMEKETLYHCIFKEKVLLVFKDSGNFLNCYEIEEESLVNRVKNCKSDSDLEEMLHDYMRENA